SRLVRRGEEAAHGVTSIAFSPDGGLLAAAYECGSVALWDPSTGKQRTRLKAGEGYSVRSVAFAPDGRTLVGGGEDQAVRLWEVASGQEVRCFHGHDDSVNCVAFAPDGRSLASGSRDFTILLWDATGLAAQGGGRSLTSGECDRLWERLAGS